MNTPWKSVIGCIVMVVALAGHAAAEGLPDILGIQLNMPVRDAYAKLEAQLPKNKIQVRSDTLPTLDKPVIRSFSSRPAQDVGGGVESDQVQVDATYPPSKQVVWRVIREHFFAN
jgi:hypothetical protein